MEAQQEEHHTLNDDFVTSVLSLYASLYDARVCLYVSRIPAPEGNEEVAETIEFSSEACDKKLSEMYETPNASEVSYVSVLMERMKTIEQKSDKNVSNEKNEQKKIE